MIHTIVSGGQTGVQRAALDTAIKLGIDYTGWIACGRRSEDGPLKERYRLHEIESIDIRESIIRNVEYADGTLVISRGKLSGWLARSVQITLRGQKQLLHADLSQRSLFEAASLICDWAESQRVKKIYVTGPLNSEDKTIYANSCSVLEASVYLGFIKTSSCGAFGAGNMAGFRQGLPVTVDQAVERLRAGLTLKDRVMIANTEAAGLERIFRWLSEYIKNDFGFYSGNPELLASCAARGGVREPLPDEACMIIIKSLWEELRKTHRIRIV